MSFFLRPGTGALLVALAIAAPHSGYAADKPPNPFCASVPRLSWLSAEEVELRLKEQGYSLIRLRMADDKCYAVRVREASGQTRDLILHPVTAEIMR